MTKDSCAPLWITYEAASDVAGVSIWTAYKWAHYGWIRIRKRGNLRVDRASLERFLLTGEPQGEPKKARIHKKFRMEKAE